MPGLKSKQISTSEEGFEMERIELGLYPSHRTI
jgi:hypothetical protein